MSFADPFDVDVAESDEAIAEYLYGGPPLAFIDNETFEFCAHGISYDDDCDGCAEDANDAFEASGF